MRNDLFAHAALYLAGWSFTVLEELDGQRNIDLLLVDGRYWEIKSPVAQGGGKHPLRFVENNLKLAKEQFREHPMTVEEDTRVVFNCRYTPVDDSEIIAELMRVMEKRCIAKVVAIKKDGSLEYLANQRKALEFPCGTTKALR